VRSNIKLKEKSGAINSHRGIRFIESLFFVPKASPGSEGREKNGAGESKCCFIFIVFRSVSDNKQQKSTQKIVWKM
jgi:hypothetical protein